MIRVVGVTSGAPQSLRAHRGSGLSRRGARFVALVLLVVLGATASLISGYRGSSASPALRHARSRLAPGGMLGLPVAARAPVSAALGADSRAYRVMRSSGGLQLVNPAQRLGASFGRSGVEVTSRGARLGLRLAMVGEGRRLSALGPATPIGRGNRVLYGRGWISEWYANGPLGLEQGFTIAKRPAGAATGTLVLAIAVSGNMRATLARNRGSLELSRGWGTDLRYPDLGASDARGRALPIWLSMRDGQMPIHVDVAGARYPLRVDPLVQQGSELVDPETTWPGNFGGDVALSSDGVTFYTG